MDLAVDSDTFTCNEPTDKRTRTVGKVRRQKNIDADAATGGIRIERKIVARVMTAWPGQAASCENSDSISEMMVFSSVFLAFESSLTNRTWAVS